MDPAFSGAEAVVVRDGRIAAVGERALLDAHISAPPRGTTSAADWSTTQSASRTRPGSAGLRGVARISVLPAMTSMRSGSTGR